MLQINNTAGCAQNIFQISTCRPVANCIDVLWCNLFF